MSTSKGRTLKLFLVDGVPNGLMTAEIMNWTGHVVTGPRSRLGELIQRPEGRRTGVYFLVGPDNGPGIGTQVYIGETDEVAQRLTAHNRPEEKGGKDFWEKVCVVTSKDTNLTKGHIKYLESRLIKVAQQAGRCQLINGTAPGYDNLPEADRADMEFFLEQIQTLLPVLGMDWLRTTPKLASAALAGVAAAPVAPGDTSPLFNGDLKKHDITARGQEINGEFVVLKGSRARLNWEGVEGSGYRQLFNELRKAGVLQPAPDGKHNLFTRDYAFSSPSAAAAVVSGRNANGRLHWTVEGSGKTYADWQDELVGQAAQAAAAEDAMPA